MPHHESQNGASANGQRALSFEEFSKPTYDAWRQVAEASLKGASFEKRLITKTYEGLDIQPMYCQDDIDSLSHTATLPGFAPYVRGTTPLGYLTDPWAIAQEFAYATPDVCNAALRADLERGLTAVNLVLDAATLAGLDADQAETVGQGGVSLSSVSDVVALLHDIDIASLPVFVNAETSALPILALLVAAANTQRVSPDSLSGAVTFDPLGALARTGRLPAPIDRAYDTMAAMATWAHTNAPLLKTTTVQSHPYHNAGATAVQELAIAIATGVAYLRAMIERNVPIDTAASQLRFSFSIGANFFMEIAKLRAARLVWAQVVSAFGGGEQAQQMTIHARTSSWNKTVYDPYVNMLRTTTESFSAVMGGCNSLHVGHFDEPLRQPDAFSRRISRNTHLILQQECHFTQPIDPAGGSWYVEYLTNEIAKRAWKQFQEIEQQGGVLAVLQSGTIQEQIEAIAQQRAANIAKRKDVFVGTNMYANLTEKPLDIPAVDQQAIRQARTQAIAAHRASTDQAACQTALERLRGAAATSPALVDAAIAAAAAGATLGDIRGAVRTDEPMSITPVRIHRGTQQFESVRAASEASRQQTGTLPRVFLANLGPIPQHKARADFTTGFFQTGGFEVLQNQGFATPDEAAQAAIESGAPIVVICSTDATYPDAVPPITKAIKAARPETTVILAGYPKDQIEAHKAAGVDDFIFLGANVYDMLLGLQQKLGVV